MALDSAATQRNDVIDGGGFPAAVDTGTPVADRQVLGCGNRTSDRCCPLAGPSGVAQGDPGRPAFILGDGCRAARTAHPVVTHKLFTTVIADSGCLRAGEAQFHVTRESAATLFAGAVLGIARAAEPAATDELGVAGSALTS